MRNSVYEHQWQDKLLLLMGNDGRMTLLQIRDILLEILALDMVSDSLQDAIAAQS